MEPSQELLDFVKKWEGLRLKAYTDQAGRVTIGYGHTGNIQVGEAWSQEQADEQLVYDLKQCLSKINELVRAPINSHQLTALGSFTYNLGWPSLAKSGLLRFINLRKYEDAADQFLLWCHIGLYKSPGLLARREAERALFLKDDNEKA
jgi:lysozyme